MRPAKTGRNARFFRLAISPKLRSSKFRNHFDLSNYITIKFFHVFGGDPILLMQFPANYFFFVFIHKCFADCKFRDIADAIFIQFSIPVPGDLSAYASLDTG